LHWRLIVLVAALLHQDPVPTLCGIYVAAGA